MCGLFALHFYIYQIEMESHRIFRSYLSSDERMTEPSLSTSNGPGSLYVPKDRYIPTDANNFDGNP